MDMEPPQEEHSFIKTKKTLLLTSKKAIEDTERIPSIGYMMNYYINFEKKYSLP